MSREETEDKKYKIQCKCVEWFRSKYPHYVLFSTMNNTASARWKYYEKSGLYRGVADLILVADGKVLFINIQQNYAPQSAYQNKFADKVQSLGYPFRTVRCLETFQECVIVWLLGGDVGKVPDYWLYEKKRRTKHCEVSYVETRGCKKRSFKYND